MNCDQCSKLRSGCKGKSNPHGVCTAVGNDFLEVHDWLADIKLPSTQAPFDCVEVRFKNGRKAFYRNVNNFPLAVGDTIAVESSPGHDIGNVSIVGELTRIQMLKKGEDPLDQEIKKIYRIATQRDIDIWQNAISREKTTLVRTREICHKLGLAMKLCDVEYQGDNLKATFFYTAEGRVDFRQLIKELAGAFGVRIEMRQIGLRQEAARVGSIGSCGRELCCTTWLTDFRSVNTSAARYQRLSLNPQKLAGQCGKLKCCLNYELDVYIDALKDFPSTDIALHTEKGTAYFQKMDVFKGMFWYAYDFEFMNWIGLDVQAVAKIQKDNCRGQKPESLEYFVVEPSKESISKAATTQMQAIEEDSLTRFDSKSSSGGRNNSRRDRDRDRNRNDRSQQPQQQRDPAQQREQRAPRPESPNTNQNTQSDNRKPKDQSAQQPSQAPKAPREQNRQREQNSPRNDQQRQPRREPSPRDPNQAPSQDSQNQRSDRPRRPFRNNRPNNNRPNDNNNGEPKSSPSKSNE